MERNLSIDQSVYIIPLTNSRDYKAIDRALVELGETGKMPLMGKVIKMWKSDDLSHHGSSYYETYYMAIGADGAQYTTKQLPGASHMHGVAELVPIDTFIGLVRRKRDSNNEKINKLSRHNSIYENILIKANMLGKV